MNRLLLLFFVLSIVLVVSCRDKESAPKIQTDQPTDQSEIPKDFIQFYSDFHLDSVFQIEHIIFPLSGKSIISEMGSSIPYKFSLDAWKLHKPYNDMNGTYHRKFVAFNGIVQETISANGGMFTMVRRFAKIQDEWQLIYYEPMGMY